VITDRVRAGCDPRVMPWRSEENGSRSYVIWAELLVAEGRQVGEVVGALMHELSARHQIVGWGNSHGEDMAGTELEIELLSEDEDMAVRRSLTELASQVAGVERLELADRDPLDPAHD
jgi:hypothetical protein